MTGSQISDIITNPRQIEKSVCNIILEYVCSYLQQLLRIQEQRLCDVVEIVFVTR